MAFLGFLSINRAIEVYMLVLFGLNCLQMLDFKYSVGLVKFAVIFDCKKIFQNVCYSRRRLDWCTLGLPHLIHFFFNRFHENEVYYTAGEVCLRSESVPVVKFCDQNQELLCNIIMVLASQVSDILRFVDLLIKCTFSPELI